MSEQTSLFTIAICMIILVVAALIFAVGVVGALFLFKNMVSKKVDEALAKVQPVVDRATTIAEQARETTESISNRLDSITTRVEQTAEKVTGRVESVSERVDTAVSPQMATVVGVAGAAVRAYQIYHDIKAAREGNGEEKSRPEVC